MSTSKRSGRVSDSPPVVVAPRGAPLPMVTQPIHPLDENTRFDNPMLRADRIDPRVDPRVDPALTVQQRVSPAATEAAVVFSKAQQLAAPQPKIVPSGPPPEIGLTQHHLPPDEFPDPRLALVIDPDSERAAAFRVLRHRILEHGRPQVIIVSSPVVGDGKTTVAANLALALAECGRAKVLLCETHVRRPQMATMFRCVPPWCFAEQLAAHRHQPMLPWSMIEIPQLWLHVAPINPRIEKTQLLDAPAFAIAMERLRQGGYEHIVIDAPPVLGSADVNLMADAADAVVFALRAQVSTTRDLRKAIEQIGAAKIAGTVLVE